MKRRTLLQAAPALLGAPGLLLAQTGFPAKPIRYIVPVSAGGGSDMVGRTVTERWGKLLNQTFVVDKQGGGGGEVHHAVHHLGVDVEDLAAGLRIVAGPNVVDATLAGLHLPPVDRAFITRTIGKGSEHLIRQTLAAVGGDPARYELAWAAYQRHYLAINGQHVTVYPGVREGLQRLKAAYLGSRLYGG